MDPIRFEQDVVEPGHTWTFCPCVTEAGRYNRLVIETRDGFVVTGLWVDRKSFFSEPTELPASAFAEGVAIRLALPRFTKDTRIEFGVRNTSEERKAFVARLEPAGVEAAAR